MSGKGEGKRRNRAAQSLQHGYRERPEEKAARPDAGEKGGAGVDTQPERQRTLDKMRELEERRRDQEKETG